MMAVSVMLCADPSVEELCRLVVERCPSPDTERAMLDKHLVDEALAFLDRALAPTGWQEHRVHFPCVWGAPLEDRGGVLIVIVEENIVVDIARNAVEQDKTAGIREILASASKMRKDSGMIGDDIVN